MQRFFLKLFIFFSVLLFQNGSFAFLFWSPVIPNFLQTNNAGALAIFFRSVKLSTGIPFSTSITSLTYSLIHQTNICTSYGWYDPCCFFLYYFNQMVVDWVLNIILLLPLRRLIFNQKTFIMCIFEFQLSILTQHPLQKWMERQLRSNGLSPSLTAQSQSHIEAYF